MAKDSSTPFIEVARGIGISDATVHLRIRRLLAAGIITRSTIFVDLKCLLEYDHTAFVGINIKPDSADQTTEGLSNLEGVGDT